MTVPSRLTVVVASDDSYIQHLAVTLLSVVDNCHRSEALNLYVLDGGISNANRARLKMLFSESGAHLKILSPQLEDTDSIPLKRYGHAALLRISLDRILPQEERRALYLDCDIVVNADIEELFQIDLEGHPVGAVQNLGCTPGKRLGIESSKYFNSGVLLIDLALWREQKIGEKALNYMRHNSSLLQYPDQDGLNAILHNDWKRLPLRWNQQPAIYSMLNKQHRGSERQQEFLEAVQQPAIIHFLSNNKPWHYMSFHPLKQRYWDYLRRTPWQDYRYPDRCAGNIIRKWLMLERQLKQWYRRRLITRGTTTLRH